MSNGKDYYNILGVGKSASPEDIKQAYRKLAREHHPDMVKDGDKAAAEKRFKEINEAYQILSDDKKRKVYDQYGSAAFSQAGGGQGGYGGFNQGQWGPFTYSYSNGNGQQDFGDFDPFDVFEQFFGFRGFGGANRAPRKGKNLHYELLIDFPEAVFGAEKQVSVDSGKLVIKIPQGARDGTELRYEGKGMPGPNGLPSGDLFITIRVREPKEFRIVGDDILISVKISFASAVLGDVIDVPVIDPSAQKGLGTTGLKIPGATQHGTRFLLRGKGMPKLRGRGQGDAYVDVYIDVPNRVSKRQRELLEEFRKS